MLGRPFPQVMTWVFALGFCMVLFFANFQKNIIKGALATLINLPLSVVSAFSDVVSYLRLFAVGVATVVVAVSFNAMVADMASGSIIGMVAAGVVLLFGHSLNLALGVMAVVVHGLRLNMLEFSGHLGMEWSGREYDPFR